MYICDYYYAKLAFIVVLWSAFVIFKLLHGNPRFDFGPYSGGARTNYPSKDLGGLSVWKGEPSRFIPTVQLPLCMWNPLIWN